MTARRRRQTATAYLFLLPGLLLFAVFRVYPLLEGLRLSFTNARLGRAAYQFVGLANYTRLLEDARFQVSLWNTCFYTLASTLPVLAVPLGLAVALNRGALRNVLRSAFFFPFTLSVVTVGLTWLWLLDPVVGPFNYYLRALGLPARSWLADPATAMWAIIATTVWWVTWLHYSNEPLFVVLNLIELIAGTAVVVFGQCALNAYWAVRPGPPAEGRMLQTDWFALGMAAAFFVFITVTNVTAPTN